MIVYGWNNYCLKTITSKEISTNESDTLNAKIQYRIKYFHLFWIPVFPLGTYWTLNMNGKQMELTPEMKAALNTVDKSNFMWIFSWSGILLPLLIFGGMQLQSKMERRRYSSHMEDSRIYLESYFKDQSKHQSLNERVDALTNLCDSILEYHIESGGDVSVDVDRASIPMDTAETAMIMRYFETIATQPESIEGLNESNTVILTRGHDFTEGFYTLPQGVIIRSIKAGEWQGSDDTATVLGQIRRLESIQYIALVKEENWVAPIILKNSFNSGYWFGSVVVYDFVNKKEFSRFKIMALNSDKVSYYGEKEGQITLGSLEADLKRNVQKAVEDILYNRKKSSSTDSTAVTD